MKVLVVGASGATGKHLVNQLLEKGKSVKIIIRSKQSIPQEWLENNMLEIIIGNILEIPDEQIWAYLSDCDSIASCLGHNLTFKGLFYPPRKLVRDAIQKLSEAIIQQEKKQSVKLVLMNTSWYQNKNLWEARSFGEKCIVGLIRLLLPPHSDNEKAADYLQYTLGEKNSSIEWVGIRPDSLINEDHVTDYQLYPSPIRSAIFNPGKTSRINVGNFMANLICDQVLWDTWKGSMPVIYNSSSLEEK